MSVHRISAFEAFLLKSDDAIVKHFMNYLPAREVLTVGKLNRRMRYWLDYYHNEVWDMVLFASEYVERPTWLLALMDGFHAMIYGEAVLKFFLRWTSPPYELDICTTLTKFYDIRRFLLDDGYRATRGSPTKMYALIEDTIEQAERRDNSWFLTGDRSCDPESHLSYKFPFVKHGTGNLRRVNVHLIRCEPYRHVLASAVSECLSARYVGT